MTTEIGMSRHLSAPYAEVVDRVKDALAAEGFGVLTEVDIRSTLKAKLDVEFPDYVIIGACNPALAHRALSDDPDVGLLLPCNVVVRADGEGSTVSIFDPVVGMALAGSTTLDAVAIEAKARLERVLQEL